MCPRPHLGQDVILRFNEHLIPELRELSKETLTAKEDIRLQRERVNTKLSKREQAGGAPCVNVAPDGSRAVDAAIADRSAFDISLIMSAPFSIFLIFDCWSTFAVLRCFIRVLQYQQRTSSASER